MGRKKWKRKGEVILNCECVKYAHIIYNIHTYIYILYIHVCIYTNTYIYLAGIYSCMKQHQPNQTMCTFLIHFRALIELQCYIINILSLNEYQVQENNILRIFIIFENIFCMLLLLLLYIFSMVLIHLTEEIALYCPYKLHMNKSLVLSKFMKKSKTIK